MGYTLLIRKVEYCSVNSILGILIGKFFIFYQEKELKQVQKYFEYLELSLSDRNLHYLHLALKLHKLSL